MRTKKFVTFLVSYFLIMVQIPVMAQEGGSSSDAESCSNGRVWNKNAGACLLPSDNTRVDEKQKMCDSKAPGAAKDECNAMVQSFAADASGGTRVAGQETKKEKGIKVTAAVASATHTVLYGTVGGGFKAAGSAIKSLIATKDTADVAGKSTGAVESNFCISGAISFATFIMGIMNQKNMKKQVKETLKNSRKELDRLLKENEQNQGVTYEMQIKLMQAYQQSLNGAKQAAQIREDGYKQEVTMHTIATTIAAIELAYNWWNAKALSCAAWSLAGSVISLGFNMQLEKAAGEAKEKYGSEADKLGVILKKYMDFFNKRHTDQTAFNLQIATNRGAAAPLNVSVNPKEFKNTSLTKEEKLMCSNSPDVGCCNDSGKKCPTFSISMAPPSIATALEKAGLDGALKRADARLQGRLANTPKNSLAIENDKRRAKAFNKRVLDQLQKKGLLTSAEAELFDVDKQMKAFLKKGFGDENYKFKSGLGDNFALGDTDRMKKLLEGSETPKELKDDKKNLANSLANISVSKGKFKLPKGMDLELEDELEEDESALNGDLENGELAANEEYVIDENQIVKKPEVSIFQVISNRYNVLRISKRFGQRAKK